MQRLHAFLNVRAQAVPFGRRRIEVLTEVLEKAHLPPLSVTKGPMPGPTSVNLCEVTLDRHRATLASCHERERRRNCCVEKVGIADPVIEEVHVHKEGDDFVG